ncbi:Ecotropic viral integration site 5 [Choanephora cucurbitarum]|uniref:Ecotropic viral integration site 5 n=1 Tax=Choanephora cucurbitarum TaxID=101091 RepID=A0A1C7NS98_9FUNG|nr:Ecotropic viral integration site 5 [Choanephora cucurbitarum]
MTTVAPLAPEAIDRLRTLRNQNKPVSVDKVLIAAHLPDQTTSSSQEKSSLAERRKLQPNFRQLKLRANQSTAYLSDTEEKVLKRLEEANAKLPAQDSEEYMLAHLERQNALLNADPKSVCIESNRLQADFRTIRNLVSDATFSPVREDYEETIQAMLAKAPLKEEATDYDHDEWDFWQEVVKDFPAAVAKFPHLLTAKLQHGGIPHRIRGVIWQAMSQSSSLNLESLYHTLSEENETSSYERIIQRDLSRTFPQLDMFKDDGGEGQLAMGRLLKAYSLYDAHVGYCQGLAFLVGPLLMTMPEKQAFCVFVRLMETYDMRTMFTLNMEGLHLRLHQFGMLLSQLCPRLDAHFKCHQIHTAMYASQWYLTLFAYSFPISLVLRIYDLVFAEGAVETITRVAVALMQKNEEALLEITEFEHLMMYLGSRKLYEAGYNSDPEAVIHDAMALSSVITKQKMDSISDSYHREMEQGKTRAQQVLAIRFGGWSLPGKSPKRPSNNKRDSWFSWGSTVALDETTSKSDSIIPSSSATSSQHDIVPSSQDRTVPLLHEQIEDLVVALSHLQKENSQITEDLMARQMKEMDWAKEREELLQKNARLERQLGHRLDPLEDQLSDADSSVVETPSDRLQKEAEFVGFVKSLELSGDFGSLIAGALATDPQPEMDNKMLRREQDDPVSLKDQPERVIKETAYTDLCEITSELVSIKLANFEMGQKYQKICESNEELARALKITKEGQAALIERIMELQTTIESLQVDKEHLLQERDHLIEENQVLAERDSTITKTCADLQLEKLSLDKDCHDLKEKIMELEEQRREYLMPRGSFAEEVFAAHQSLFGTESVPMSRRHTLQVFSDEKDVYQKKYIESDLRCRELEKMLAETKFRLVEYETASGGSVQQNRRSTIQTKRSSVLSRTGSSCSSIIAPLSPTFGEPRESNESLRSTVSSSSNHHKRASMYSRFVNILGTGSLTEETQAIVEEPQRLNCH